MVVFVCINRVLHRHFAVGRFERPRELCKENGSGHADKQDRVKDMKVTLSRTEQLVKNLPNEFYAIMDHIKTLKFEDRPNYEALFDLMKAAFEKEGGTPSSPNDWEEVSEEALPPLN